MGPLAIPVAAFTVTSAVVVVTRNHDNDDDTDYSYESRRRIREQEEELERSRRIKEQQRIEEEQRKRNEEEKNKKIKERFEESKKMLLIDYKNEIRPNFKENLKNYCLDKLKNFSNEQKYKLFLENVLNLNQIKEVKIIKIEEIYSNLFKKFNEKKKYKILILGKTGVGKSTLINGIFDDNLTEEKIGEVCINNEIPQPFSNEKNPSLVLYDSRGIEVSGENDLQNLLKNISNFIHSKNDDKEEMVDCIWYCVKGTRIEEDELKFLGKLKEIYYGKFPFVIVYTLSIDENSEKIMKEVIEEIMDDKINFVPVLAKDFPLKKNNVVEKFGLEELIEITKKEIDKNKKHLEFVVLMEKINVEINFLVEKDYISINKEKVDQLFNYNISEYIKKIKKDGIDKIIQEKLEKLVNKLKETENTIKAEFGTTGDMINNYLEIQNEMKKEFNDFYNTEDGSIIELELKEKIYGMLKEDIVKNMRADFEVKKTKFISEQNN